MSDPTLQHDPNLKLPKSVLAASARADEIHRAMLGQTEEGQNDQEGVTQDGNPDTDPASLASNPVDGNQAPQTDTNAQNQTQNAQNTQGGEGEETWEHKYKSVHGRYVRAQETIRQQADTIQNLQNVIATMQASGPSGPSGPVTSEVTELSAEKLITPEEANDYGEDFLKVVGKKAREELAPVINGYKTEIDRLKKQLEGVSGVFQQDAQKKLLSNLDEKLPNWRQLNTDQQFLDWLSLPDPYSGVIRHDMLKAAYAQGNAHRVLAFFNGFLAEEAAVAPASAEPEVGTTTVPKVPLQNLAAPGRAKTAAATTAPAEKPFFTRAQIAAFYADVAAGKYRGRDADKNKAEVEIFSAQREGRIR